MKTRAFRIGVALAVLVLMFAAFLAQHAEADFGNVGSYGSIGSGSGAPAPIGAQTYRFGVYRVPTNTASAALMPGLIAYETQSPHSQSNSLQELHEFYRYNVPLVGGKPVALTNWDLSADVYVHDIPQTIPNSTTTAGGVVGLTNVTLNGNGHTIFSLETNNADIFAAALFTVCGNVTIQNLNVTNVFPFRNGNNTAPGQGLSPIFRNSDYSGATTWVASLTNLVVKDCTFSGFAAAFCELSEGAVNSTVSPANPTIYMTNVNYLNSYLNNPGENNFTFFSVGCSIVCSNCNFQNGGVAAAGGIIEAPAGKWYGVGCNFWSTNGFGATPRTGANGLQNYVASLADPPYTVGLTNCNLYYNANVGDYFQPDADPANTACCLLFNALNNSQNNCAFVNCFFNLAYGNGVMGMLGIMVDSGGGLTDNGPMLFKNCVVWPQTNGVIFWNNNFPVTIVGGNLKASNFNNPAKVTVQ